MTYKLIYVTNPHHDFTWNTDSYRSIMTDNITYKDAGVDIDTANEFVERIKASIKTTARKEVVAGIGGFGGLFRLNTVDLKNPSRLMKAIDESD